MSTNVALLPSADLRAEFRRLGGSTVGRCFQCATCSAVCELAPDDTPFPRRQMLWAQWGLGERLVADPSIWLCHQCNDCNVRCPRDAQPGDVLQTARAVVVEQLAFPGFLGKLVAAARHTWPLLLALPLIYWIAILTVVNGFQIPGVNAELSFVEGRFHYDSFVPHWLIYATFFPVAAWVTLAGWMSGRRFWRLLGSNGPPRKASFLSKLWPALSEVITHKRFSNCDGGALKRWSHLTLMWGFVGAAVTSGLLVVYLYGFQMYPLPLNHWVKWLGNISAVLLVVGAVLLFANRFRDIKRVGKPTAFDRFFLGCVLGVVFTGCLSEFARFYLEPAIAAWVYVFHLGVVLTLFLTFPYSKFAHMLYRLLAMVHRLTLEPAEDGQG